MVSHIETRTVALEALFTPFNVKDVTLRNRFVMAPMQKHEPPDLVPTREMAEYYRRRVEGGVALVVTQGVTMDHPTSQSPYASFIPRAYDGWKRCVDAVGDAGGHMFLQLWHEGANRSGGFGPSGISSWGETTGDALELSQIAELIDVYARSAYDAKQLGFSGVEIHGAHGYLVDQFFSEDCNQREDDYGGSREARMRFGVEIVRAIRAAVGSRYPISFRASQWKTRNFDAKPMPTAAALREFLTPLVEAGVDVLHASARRFSTPEFDGSNLGFAGHVKRESRLPVIAVGSVGLDNDIASTLTGAVTKAAGPANLAELLRRFDNSEFDLVAVGRAVLTDADWVNKLRESRFADMRATLSADDVFGNLSIELPDSSVG